MKTDIGRVHAFSRQSQKFKIVEASFHNAVCVVLRISINSWQHIVLTFAMEREMVSRVRRSVLDGVLHPLQTGEVLFLFEKI
jgi:hypothetical protein